LPKCEEGCFCFAVRGEGGQEREEKSVLFLLWRVLMLLTGVIGVVCFLLPIYIVQVEVYTLY